MEKMEKTDWMVNPVKTERMELTEKMGRMGNLEKTG